MNPGASPVNVALFSLCRGNCAHIQAGAGWPLIQWLLSSKGSLYTEAERGELRGRGAGSWGRGGAQSEVPQAEERHPRRKPGHPPGKAMSPGGRRRERGSAAP